MATDKAKVLLVEQLGENRGKLEDYHGKGECKEPECEDLLTIYIKADRQLITEIGFTITETACSPAVASASIATILAKGKPVMAAYIISKEDIMKELSDDGNMDKEHIHCAMMAEIALKRAVVDFSQRLKQEMENL